MTIIKKTALILFMAISLSAGSLSAVAEEAGKAPAANVSETVTHIENAIAEIGKSDFNTAQVHLKAARTSAEKISGHEDVVKQANAIVIQGQIKAKQGDIKNATDELNKAVTLYNSIK